MTKEIPLTQGKVALVDDEDYEELSKYKWHALLDPRMGRYYARRRVSWKGIFVPMHRFIMKTPSNMQCDHINGDTLDNRKQNLRNCSKTENNWNRGVQKNNQLGMKNITFNKLKGKYRVVIDKNGVRVFDAHFDKLETAKKARDFATKLYHGEFSNNGE